MDTAAAIRIHYHKQISDPNFSAIAPASMPHKAAISAPTICPPVATPRKTLLSKEKPDSFRGLYSVILAPGIVNYFDCVEFFTLDVDAVIAEISSKSQSPRLQFSFPDVYHPDISERKHWGETKFDQHILKPLLEDAPWHQVLRVHHALGQLWLNKGLPTFVYVAFHKHLKLRNHFAFAECMEAWVESAQFDPLIGESYVESSDHVVLGSTIVLKKTGFVVQRLKAIADEEIERIRKEQEEESRISAENEAGRDIAHIEKLRQTAFTTFIYIMEDTRNGMFKIGKSRTPGKRERTLQSEAPTTVLRFAIPGSEAHEKKLHVKFSHLRVRGEWFNLGPSELVQAIHFLKSEGDTERSEVDFHWLGEVFFRVGGGSGT